VKSGTVDQEIGFEFAGGRFGDPPTAGGGQLGDARVGDYAGAPLRNLSSECF